jgi:hypothetical protein
MALNGIPLQHEPDRLREFQTLIRHVHQQPTQMRRALRLAFKELPVQEANEKKKPTRKKTRPYNRTTYFNLTKKDQKSSKRT